MTTSWIEGAKRFVQSLAEPEAGGYRSVPNGPITLYGTCYASLARFYLGIDEPLTDRTRKFIVDSQDPKSGLLVGPELCEFSVPAGVLHDREHLLFHLTCAALPVCRQFGLTLPSSVRAAHVFCDLNYLRDWLKRRELKNAWVEGNNLLFVGQLLGYLRDEEGHPGASTALDCWFEWLDQHVDPATGLWGTNGYCAAMDAVYGGYHQLLVYYHENHSIPNPRGLVDTVLSLQNWDGGFNPNGNGGACEDVDSVDILVNLYKRFDYRRAEIRAALRRSLKHILATQNSDGGFPYNRGCPQSHMGLPGTAAPADTSTMFATWFRIHTLALMAEILTDDPRLQYEFRFSNYLSMGWHQPWDRLMHPVRLADRIPETIRDARHQLAGIGRLARRKAYGLRRRARELLATARSS